MTSTAADMTSTAADMTSTAAGALSALNNLKKRGYGIHNRRFNRL